MAPNKRKMLEAARKYAQKGAKDRALKEYEQLLKLDPKDAKLRIEVGDTHRRWGQLEEAVAAYQRVAMQYTAEGFDARAVAVYKQIQGLDPESHAVCEPLAELYQRMGLVSEAIAALQAAADGHARAGNKRRALELLRTMASLDPTNTASRIKVADLLRGEKMLDEAAAEYEAAYTELTRQGETEVAGRVIERLLELQPDCVELLMRLARNLLARDKAAQAEAPALRAAERDPEQIACLELLADVYRAQKRDDRLEEVFRKIAGIHRQHGDPESARDILQRFVSPGAFEAEAGDARGEQEESPFGDDALELDERGVDPDLLPDDDLLLEEPAPAPRHPKETTAAAAAAARRSEAVHVAAPRSVPLTLPPPRPRADPAAETVFELGAQEGSRILGDPDQLLAEASVYLRYGKRAQAIENLQAILASQPHHRPALEKLGDAYADDGDAAGAVAAWLRAAELARDEGDLDAMRLLRDRVGALDEGAAATLLDPDGGGDEGFEVGGTQIEEIDLDAETSTRAAAPAAATPRRSDPEPIKDPGDDIDVDLGEIDFDVNVEVGADPTPDASSEPGPPPADSEQISADLEEAEFYWQQSLAAEARSLFEKVLAASPGHPLALVRLGEIAAAAGEDPDTTGGDSADLGQGPPSAGCATLETLETTEPDAAGAWLASDEDPFLESGDLSGDSAALGDVLGLGEATGPLAAPNPDGYDLAAELSAALDEAAPHSARGAADDDGFQAVFDAFKRGVQKTLGSGDHEAHYDLGIAYREMGLLDDAIGEFRSAMESPARRIDSLHMLGLCALEQARGEEAVDLLSHALAAPDLAQERELAIRFELGRAYSACGEVEKARLAWEKVAAVDPSFCEVSELLHSLGPERAAPAAEFESFNDLLAEAEAAPAAAPEHESFDDLIQAVNADLDRPAAPTRGSEAEPVDPEPSEAAGPPARRSPRRSKISFV